MSIATQTASEGVVAFIDALGTKGVAARTDPQEYAKSQETLLAYWEQCKKQALKTSGSSSVSFDIRAFSDTIIITVKLIDYQATTSEITHNSIFYTNTSQQHTNFLFFVRNRSLVYTGSAELISKYSILKRKEES